MPSASQFLKSVAAAVVKHGAGLLVRGLPMGETLLSVARYAFDDYRGKQKEESLRAEIQALAQETAAEIRRQIAEAVAEAAGDQPPEARQALEGYLLQVPAAVRQTLRRPADPSGKTVPAGLALSRAEDLIPLLPTRLPRFRPGDRPPGLGDWELVELLGVGGFGEVWKAHNPHLKQWAALKFCLDAQAARSLRTETDLLARVMASGRHPGIVQLLDTYLSADPPCLKYEFIEGGDLAGLIREWHRSGTPPTPAQVAKVVRHLAEAVGFAHRLKPPIVHRDLKPANILVSSDGDGGYLFKVADFGIGGLAAEQGLARVTQKATSPGELLATAAHGSYTLLYASPQQMRSDKPDPRDDVYSLGVIWYQLLTGDLGSGAPTGMRWAEPLRQRGMSEDAIHLLASCFEAQPEHRPADAAELAEQLARLPEIAYPRPVAPVVPRPGPRPQKPAKRLPEDEPVVAEVDEEARPREERMNALVAIGLAFVVLLAVGVIAHFVRRTGTEVRQLMHGEATVAGKVTFDGSPLPNGILSFYPSDGGGMTYGCPVAEDGMYRIELPTGSYRITVQVFPAPALPPEMQPTPPGSSRVPIPALSVVPPIYKNPETTPLQLTVPGSSDLMHDILLSSSPARSE